MALIGDLIPLGICVLIFLAGIFAGWWKWGRNRQRDLRAAFMDGALTGRRYATKWEGFPWNNKASIQASVNAAIVNAAIREKRG